MWAVEEVTQAETAEMKRMAQAVRYGRFANDKEYNKWLTTS
jgi:hypothetical protein